jgi:hypothetical protein
MYTLLFTFRSHIKELVAVLFCIATSSETPVLPANLSDAAKVYIYIHTFIHHIHIIYVLYTSVVHQ